MMFSLPISKAHRLIVLPAGERSKFGNEGILKARSVNTKLSLIAAAVLALIAFSARADSVDDWLARGKPTFPTQNAQPAPHKELESGPTLLAHSFCVSLPTSDLEFGKNTGITTTIDHKIKLLVFTPEEERDIANYTHPHLAKAACIALAQEDRFVAFTIEGVDRYFATSPLNIVSK
jgi:hypothetical protein